MLKSGNFKNSVSAGLAVFTLTGAGLLSVPAYASTVDLHDFGNPGADLARPDPVPPVNPPIDTPAFYNGLANIPAMIPANVPAHTLPGSGFGQAAVPIPATFWLFGSGLLGLVGLARSRKTPQ